MTRSPRSSTHAVAGLRHQDVPLCPSLLPLLGSRWAAVSWTKAGAWDLAPFSMRSFSLATGDRARVKRKCSPGQAHPVSMSTGLLREHLSDRSLQTSALCSEPCSAPRLTWSKSYSPSHRPHSPSPSCRQLSSIQPGPLASTLMSKSLGLLDL